MNGVLEFIDTSDFTSMGNGEHFMANEVLWDPTGRSVSPFKSLKLIFVSSNSLIGPLVEAPSEGIL